MTSDSAAWLTVAKPGPFEIKSAPLLFSGDNEVLVRNCAVAVNPIDGLLQMLAVFPLNHPTILDQDVAGEVVAVGANVNFEHGTRILGHAVGVSTQRSQENAFQAYTILQTNMIAEIPDGISFESAVAGLFQDAFLNLHLPAEPAAPSTGQTILI